MYIYIYTYINLYTYIYVYIYTYICIVEHVVKTDGPITIASDWLKPGGEKERCLCISLLLSLGADVNYKDSESFHALHYACIWGWGSAIENLIQAGADVNAPTITGRTALMCAGEVYSLIVIDNMISCY
jgi:hypothetical protein